MTMGLMLYEKPQGDSVCFPSEKIEALGVDGPSVYCAETSTGNKYVYRTYAVGISGEDRTTVEMALWAAAHETIVVLLQREEPDSVILWRWRPNVHEDEDCAGRYIINMRLVIIPQAEVDKILPIDQMISTKSLLYPWPLKKHAV